VTGDDKQPPHDSPARRQRTIRDLGFLSLLTCGAVLIHGYHPFAEDAEIYVPQIRKLLDSSLYPFGAQFFESHAHMTLFPDFVAAQVRLTHLPLATVLFLCHFFSIFLLLLVCRRIAMKCFPTETARWPAVALIAALLTIPVTGTALYLMDQYFNPRSISTFSILFAVDAALQRKFLRSVLWLIFTALIHPLMVVFGTFYILILVFTEKVLAKRAVPAFAPVAASLIAVPSLLHPAPAFFQTLNAHPYYFVLRWHWYEWLGIFAPLALLWWFRCIAEAKKRRALTVVSLALIPFGITCLLGALVVSVPGLQVLAIGQPLRGFQLLYLLMLLIAGGLIGETFLKRRVLLWIALFAPLSAGMALAQVRLFPSDRHIEWPGAASSSPWVQAFAWIRVNTPSDAIFALNPKYMAVPGEDYQGFRAIAARSSLADAVKDWSASAMFPASPLATECLEQVRAAQGWQNFGAADFARLKQTYGVRWVVLDHPPPAGLRCPYHKGKLSVCRLSPR
jgi:hypothetical protein